MRRSKYGIVCWQTRGPASIPNACHRFFGKCLPANATPRAKLRCSDQPEASQRAPGCSSPGHDRQPATMMWGNARRPDLCAENPAALAGAQFPLEATKTGQLPGAASGHGGRGRLTAAGARAGEPSPTSINRCGLRVALTREMSGRPCGSVVPPCRGGLVGCAVAASMRSAAFLGTDNCSPANANRALRSASRRQRPLPAPGPIPNAQRTGNRLARLSGIPILLEHRILPRSMIVQWRSLPASFSRFCSWSSLFLGWRPGAARW